MNFCKTGICKIRNREISYSIKWISFYYFFWLSRLFYFELLVFPAAPQYRHFLNSRSNNPIAEFKTQPTSCESIDFNDAAAPCASRNGSLYRRQPLTIEPATINKIGFIIKNIDRIERIPGGNKHHISKLQVCFAHLF